MKKFKSLFLVIAGMFLALPSFAQTSESTWFANLQSMDSTQLTLLVILGVVLGVIVLLLILMIYLMTFMTAVFRKENPEMANQPSWWDEFKIKYVTGKMKPVGGKEEKELMKEHTFDGIVELDNHMPPWLANVFYLTIGFAVIYFTYFTVLGLGKTQLEEYAEEQRIAAIQIEEYKALAVSSIDETSVVFDETPAAIAAGLSIFSANCVACHAQDGGGGVGSNLTDEYWKHGGSINDIFKVIKYGVPEKGMIPWQDQLSPEEMQQVASFILTLQGTTPANPKAAEGERYVPAGVEPAKADSVAAPIAVEAVAEAK
ncbi:cbb3-type cytochrome c oxidase N-terminal domain-containing protein [Aquiflexum gelatinilyticum]|uniref:cbb3-type cytochrome c oxidase N-terminal domain-containing protein n=1 Tax=Aquiflexum gelatinilyticum TaxID=2961943 RepID=UPI0021670345|nr:cbb3-type cytochrome c oxidase N-terminal domain-containing protein [Aquiflexum gelatinilyticum]MCS4435068.1 c-type cytochrome [Aquiflexum gelatinilyticum]